METPSAFMGKPGNLAKTASTSTVNPTIFAKMTSFSGAKTASNPAKLARNLAKPYRILASPILLTNPIEGIKK